jgi:hypothetical protein
VLLTAVGSESRVERPAGGTALGGAQFAHVIIGDASAADNAWSIDRVTIPISKQEPISG